MKKVIKYYSLLLTVILFVYVINGYINYLQLLERIDNEGLLIDIIFNGWHVGISFMIIALFELSIKNKYFKLFIRIFMTLALVLSLLSDYIPIDDFDSGVENTIIFSGALSIILFLLLGSIKIYQMIFTKK